MLKIINTSSLCSLQSTGLSKNCSANRFVCSQVLKRVKRLSGKKSLKSSTGPKSAVSTITLVLLRNGESSFDLNRYRKPRLPKQVVFALEENKQETLPWRLQFPHSQIHPKPHHGHENSMTRSLLKHHRSIHIQHHRRRSQNLSEQLPKRHLVTLLRMICLDAVFKAPRV